MQAAFTTRPATRPISRPAAPAHSAHATAGIAWAELLAHRDHLVRFAQRKLHDSALAEDAVHDVFEAVLAGRARFGGESALRTWLTGVLKHKVVDLVRRRAGQQGLEALGQGECALDVECPQPRPDELAEQRQRLRHTLRRIEALPHGLRDAIRLRVLHDQPTRQVCAALSISEENLFVRLHRARKQLLS